MTRSSRPLGPRGELVVRLWVGLGFVAVGLFQMLAPPRYPPGDIRSTEGLWLIVGAMALAIGIAILALTVTWFLRQRGG